MKYVKQFGIILLISFAGEALNYLLPLPVPASIYGLVLMFLCLQLRVFRLEDVRDTALFLIEIMPLMFIPAATGLMTSWGIIRAKLFAYPSPLSRPCWSWSFRAASRSSSCAAARRYEHGIF